MNIHGDIQKKKNKSHDEDFCVSPYMKEKILELHKTGRYTQKEIAGIVGCSVPNVAYHTKDDVRMRVNRQKAKERSEAIEKLKLEAGGKCKVCKYDRCLSALDFHHIDPKQKIDTVSRVLKGYSFRAAAKEVAKCILLCCRCHREFHDGLIKLPINKSFQL